LEVRILLEVRIRAVFEQHRHRYGSPRIQRELRDRGFGCSCKRVARLMRKAGLQARPKRRFKRTTDSSHHYPVASNHLARCFSTEQIGGLNRAWAGDITCLATAQGWLYLAVLLDLHSRRVVGWAMERTLEQKLTQQALERALALRQPRVGLPDLLHHSARGSQYAATDYRALLADQGI
jgi:putative transposase